MNVFPIAVDIRKFMLECKMEKNAGVETAMIQLVQQTRKVNVIINVLREKWYIVEEIGGCPFTEQVKSNTPILSCISIIVSIQRGTKLHKTKILQHFDFKSRYFESLCPPVF